MQSSKILHTTLRFNLARPDEAEAWEYLQQCSKNSGKSYTKAVTEALLFAKKKYALQGKSPIAAEIRAAIVEGVKEAVPFLLARELLAGIPAGNAVLSLPVQPDNAAAKEEAQQSETDEASFAFLDNF